MWLSAFPPTISIKEQSSSDSRSHHPAQATNKTSFDANTVADFKHESPSFRQTPLRNLQDRPPQQRGPRRLQKSPSQAAPGLIRDFTFT
jgi:hypothetical protein